MKKIAVLFLFVALSVSAYSQSDNWYFSFSMGGSWPMGTFSKTDISNKESGFAKNGFALLLDATYPVSEHWGLKGMALMSTNPVDRNWLGTKLETRMQAFYPVIEDADRQFLSLRANSWMWNALLAGPVYTISFERIYWDFQVLGGMNVAYLPQQKLLYEKPANNWFYLDRNTSTTNVSYGFLAGTAFRFPVTDRLNLRVGVDYYHSQAKIQYEQIRVSKQGATVVTENLGSGSNVTPIEMISGSVGFVYYLN
ncbi:MAG TPA: hypothetical protein VGK38_05065 [Prolixibacteraceae bacterium]